MSNDRELLELAAKAAGLELSVENQKERDDEGYGHRGLWICRPKINTAWNPLTDDGDALHLAVKLKIEVAPEVFSKSRADARPPCGKWLWEAYSDHGDDAQKATRRAIVRAAAEIGRSMP